MPGLPPTQLRLLHVHAHPDDESSKGAATTAKYVDEGVEVLVATCTGGERGSVLNPKLADDPQVLANISEIRAREMERARELLGFRQVWLGFVDSGLPEGDPLPPLPDDAFGLVDPVVAAGALVKVIREFRPHVVTTYDEQGGYPHPDHVMCHRITLEAFKAAADPDLWPEHGPAWQPAKLYYHMSFHSRRAEQLELVMHEQGLDCQFAHLDQDPFSYGRLTTFIECAKYFPIRDEALRAHATQIDPDGPWFAVPLAIQQAGWPTEDYQLVVSKVPTMIPEDDLFSGLRPQPLVPEFMI
ncbi:mycothiol conjugate amidase Mca [Tessaracoccus aquimaris]|uniref:Mycothiol S-conjugate amidase n=1 Tax=Tessaracoccus aquimaris TaxID=1332264 RepID=A0A1Q2CPH5_9ACTN|nr:mycothiol conjugate amidase Mca [Tessaracoccus aquimaris]AQP47940.1 mycothiol conjugate amidase Mca [Tessaracoccus aquimaris]